MKTWYTLSDKTFKGTVRDRTSQYFNRGSFEFTSTVHLKKFLTYLKALHVVPDRPCIKQWVAQWTFDLATLV